MPLSRSWRAIALSAASLISTAAHAAGDLLVAPTRVVFDGARGTEVILNNVGQTTATYRISLELKRMTEAGEVVDIPPEQANATEQAALAMISYAPRRVVLPPNQPQAIRIGVRPPADLPDGEYRAHMLFRAIPDATPPTPTEAAGQSLSVALTPIYGITIPIIVRKGTLRATATLADPKLVLSPDGPALAFTLTRSGDRSVYGRIRVTKPGVAKPIFEARGIAVYPELTRRVVQIPVEPAVASQMTGPARIEYLEDSDSGTGVIADVQAVIR